MGRFIFILRGAVGLIYLMGFLPVAQARPAPAFTGENPLRVEEGYFHLKWQASELGEGIIYQIESSDSPVFQGTTKQLYTGRESSLFLSGLRDGDYFYRVRAKTSGPYGPWSDVQEVQVRHHSLKKAWFLFIIGAVAFILILAVILSRPRHLRKKDP